MQYFFLHVYNRYLNDVLHQFQSGIREHLCSIKAKEYSVKTELKISFHVIYDKRIV